MISAVICSALAALENVCYPMELVGVSPKEAKEKAYSSSCVSVSGRNR